MKATATDALSRALVRIWSVTGHQKGDDHDRSMRAMADQIHASPYEPAIVLAVLAAWPEDNRWWPTWAELNTALAAEQDQQRHEQKQIAPAGAQETFSQRTSRLYGRGLSARRMSDIGVGRWRTLMPGHASLTDDELLAAFDRLEQGLPVNSASTHRMNEADLAEAIELLDGPAADPVEAIDDWKPLASIVGDRDRLRTLGVSMLGAGRFPPHWAEAWGRRYPNEELPA